MIPRLVATHRPRLCRGTSTHRRRKTHARKIDEGKIGCRRTRAVYEPAHTSPPSARACARARDGDENQRPWPADKVERWAIDRLIPYAKNARTHSDAQDRRDSREHQGVGLDDAGAGGRGWRPDCGAP